MTASTMLFVIACVVAVLGFVLAGVIWSAHPVRGTSVECGTLRNPMNPPEFVRVVSTADPSADIQAALAPQRCEEARAGVLFSQRMALAAGGAAAITAVGAFAADRRERFYATNDVNRLTRSDSELNGYGLPGRPPPVVKLMDADAGWWSGSGEHSDAEAGGERSPANPGTLRGLRG